jgi:nitrogen fixation protein NifU and related proteins
LSNSRRSTLTTPDPAGDSSPRSAGDAGALTRGGKAVDDAADLEAILELFRHPRGKGAVPNPDAEATANNPLCGESMTVTLSLDRSRGEPRVSDARFQSDGCSISLASASIMTELVRGLSAAEVQSLIDALKALLRGDQSPAVTDMVGRLRILGGVARFPGRVACALLPWDALSRALQPTSRP